KNTYKKEIYNFWLLAAASARGPDGFGDERRSAEDHARVDLNEAGAGIQLGLGFGAVGDAAGGDDGQFAGQGLGQGGDHGGGFLEDGRAGQAAGFVAM